MSPVPYGNGYDTTSMRPWTDTSSAPAWSLATSFPLPEPQVILSPLCEHCWCKEFQNTCSHEVEEPHAQCCKCEERMAKRFVFETEEK